MACQNDRPEKKTLDDISQNSSLLKSCCSCFHPYALVSSLILSKIEAGVEAM